jgi:hypothetical protein
MFPATATLALLACAYLWYRWRRKVSAGLVAFVLVGLVLLVQPPVRFVFDFRDYEWAAYNLDTVRDPYAGLAQGENQYFYPPLLAEIFSGAHRALTVGGEALHLQTAGPAFTPAERQAPPAPPGAYWDLLQDLYAFLQVPLLLLCMFLTQRLARRVGLPPVFSAVASGLLFVCNYPLVATLMHYQANLFLLASLLGFLLLLEGIPWLGGVLLAVGVSLKMYPVACFPGLILGRRWLALAGAAVGLALLLVLPPGNLALWSRYLHVLPNSPTSTQWRVATVWSVSARLWSPVAHLAHLSPAPQALGRRALWALLALVLAWYFGRRLVQRERAFSAWRRAHLDSPQLRQGRYLRTLADCLDLLGLSLIWSPVVWDHHYVVLIPLAVLALALCEKKHLVWVVVGTGLLFFVKEMPIFLLQYHRLAGLLLLVWAIPPGAFQPARTQDLPEVLRQERIG